MFDWLKRKRWPEIGVDDIRKRARLLVIDDFDFPYQELFRRDGYAIEKWNDVKNLSQLESGAFDVILLDILGVGKSESVDQGFGVLKHLRVAAPAQIVIAYSNSDWSLRYQEFFDMADAKLDKRADYVEFKRVVDEQLRRRFSLGFYVERVFKLVGPGTGDPEKLRKLVENAILTRDTGKLERYLSASKEALEVMKLVLGVVQVAIGIASL
jgi:CheY-like chemotaxis protein